MKTRTVVIIASIVVFICFIFYFIISMLMHKASDNILQRFNEVERSLHSLDSLPLNVSPDLDSDKIIQSLAPGKRESALALKRKADSVCEIISEFKTWVISPAALQTDSSAANTKMDYARNLKNCLISFKDFLRRNFSAIDLKWLDSLINTRDNVCDENSWEKCNFLSVSTGGVVVNLTMIQENVKTAVHYSLSELSSLESKTK